MGGRGSGGRNSKGKLRDVQCARLDVHELAREGKLKLGARGWLFGTIRFEVQGTNLHSPQLCSRFQGGPPAGRHWSRSYRRSTAKGAMLIMAGDI